MHIQNPMVYFIYFVLVSWKKKHFFYSSCCWNFFYVFVLSLDDGIEPGSVTLSHFKIQVKYFFVFFFSFSRQMYVQNRKKSRQSHVCTIVFLNVIITVSLETGTVSNPLFLYPTFRFVCSFFFIIFQPMKTIVQNVDNVFEREICSPQVLKVFRWCMLKYFVNIEIFQLKTDNMYSFTNTKKNTTTN